MQSAESFVFVCDYMVSELTTLYWIRIQVLIPGRG